MEIPTIETELASRSMHVAYRVQVVLSPDQKPIACNGRGRQGEAFEGVYAQELKLFPCFDHKGKSLFIDAEDHTVIRPWRGGEVTSSLVDSRPIGSFARLCIISGEDPLVGECIQAAVVNYWGW